MIRAWTSPSNRVVFLCALLSACWLSPGRRNACSAEPVLRIQVSDTRPEMAFLSWDTEGGDRVQTNLLRAGQGVTPRVRMGGQWSSATSTLRGSISKKPLLTATAAIRAATVLPACPRRAEK